MTMSGESRPRKLEVQQAQRSNKTPLDWEGHSFQWCRRDNEGSRALAPEANRHRAASSAVLRWCKFNLVGGIGIAVQFAALFLLKTVLHFNYLLATALAVEAAVVHNFVWHEQFTWVDRIKPHATQPSWRQSLPRLLRFNLTNGAVSILGNLALMKLMVGQGHVNYLVANAVAITLCSLANFLVSDHWVFEG